VNTVQVTEENQTSCKVEGIGEIENLDRKFCSKGDEKYKCVKNRTKSRTN
jgi:hypothetical protein